jgi:serine/threonine protein kinase
MFKTKMFKKNPYQRKKVSKKVSINQLNTQGTYELRKFLITKMRKRKTLPNIEQWRFLEAKSGTTFFELPNGKKIAVKPELTTSFPKAIITTKGNNKGRHMLPILNKLIKKRVRIETPLGEIETKSGQKFYITRVVEGKTLADFIHTSPPGKISEIVQKMAIELANIHQRGVIHGHPHNLNWIIHNGKAKLIDVKGVSFKEDYSHNIWKTMTDNDRHTVTDSLPKFFRPIFNSEYWKRTK